MSSLEYHSKNKRTYYLNNKTYKKGAILFNQGENSKEMYILNFGRLEVIVDNQKIAIIDKRGVFLGEMASILGEPRNATVRVAEESSLIVIPADIVNEVILSKPQIGVSLIKILANRLKETTKNFTNLQKMYFKIKQEYEEVKGLVKKTSNLSKNVYDYIVETNLCTIEEMEKSKEKLEQLNSSGDKSNLGQVLVEDGIITYDELLRSIRAFKEIQSK